MKTKKCTTMRATGRDQRTALASPLRLTVGLERGFLAMNVELQGLASSLITQYPIPRFNVSGLYDAPMVRDAFAKAAPAMTLLDLLDAELIETTADGTVRFR